MRQKAEPTGADGLEAIISARRLDATAAARRCAALLRQPTPARPPHHEHAGPFGERACPTGTSDG
jgi:hypothetical protein